MKTKQPTIEELIEAHRAEYQRTTGRNDLLIAYKDGYFYPLSNKPGSMGRQTGRPWHGRKVFQSVINTLAARPGFQKKPKQQLDTTIYANGRIVKNSVTGLYWGGPAVGFSAPADKAVLVDSSEIAVLRYTYANVVEEQVATLLDEVSSALNTTGEVGWFMNARNIARNICELMTKGNAKVAVYRRPTDGLTEVSLTVNEHSRFPRRAYKVISNLSELSTVLTSWK